MTLEGGRREKGGRRGQRKEGVGRETKDQSGRRGTEKADGEKRRGRGEEEEGGERPGLSPTCSMMMSLSNMTSLL